MNDKDLIRTLDSFSDLSDREKLLLDRLECYAFQESPEEVENRLKKSYESALEQSEFRRQLIEEMIETSEEWPKKYYRELEQLINNSYVEL